MNRVKYGCKFVAALILITLLMHWHIVFRPLKIVYYLQAMNGFAIMLVVMGLLFLTVNLFAAAGIYRRKWWGFVMTYLAIVFSTLIFAVSYIPFFDRLFPVRYASLSLLLANFGVIVLVIYLQMQCDAKPPRMKVSRVKKEVEKKIKAKAKTKKK